MNNKKLNIFRWIARIWSLLPILFAVAHLFEDETNQTGEVFFTDYLLLSLLGIYVLGLALAWKWDLIGGIISTLTFTIFIILFAIFVEANFTVFLIFFFGAFPPALIFLYYGLEIKKNSLDS